MTLPFLQYQWKNYKYTDLTTIEIHLPATTIPCKFHMQLVEKWYSCFCTYSQSFHCFSLPVQWGKDCASWAIAREDMIKTFRKKHYNIMEVKRELAKLRMHVVLLFVRTFSILRTVMEFTPMQEQN